MCLQSIEEVRRYIGVTVPGWEICCFIIQMNAGKMRGWLGKCVSEWVSKSVSEMGVSDKP